MFSKELGSHLSEQLQVSTTFDKQLAALLSKDTASFPWQALKVLLWAPEWIPLEEDPHTLVP